MVQVMMDWHQFSYNSIVTKEMELASEMVSLLGKELKSVWSNMRLGVLNGMSGMTGALAGITT
jgi:hypothetical protein